MDLYRLSGLPDDFQPLNLNFVFSNCIALIEWPSRLGDLLPQDRLDINIRILNKETDVDEDRPRRMVIEPHGVKWTDRIQLMRDEGLLDDLMDADTDI